MRLAATIERRKPWPLRSSPTASDGRALAPRSFGLPQQLHHPIEVLGTDGGLVVAAFAAAVEGERLLDQVGAERGGQRRGHQRKGAAPVGAVLEPHRHPVLLAGRGHLGEAQVFDPRRGRGRAAQQHGPESGHRSSASRIAAGASPAAPSSTGRGGGDLADPLGVLGVARGDLDGVDLGLGGQGQGWGIEGLDDHGQARRPGRAQHALPVARAKLHLPQPLPLGMPPDHQALGLVDLELDGVSTHLERGLDHAQGGLGLSFVGGAGFGHHQAGLAGAHYSGAQGHRRGLHRGASTRGRARGRRPYRNRSMAKFRRAIVISSRVSLEASRARFLKCMGTSPSRKPFIQA